MAITFLSAAPSGVAINGAASIVINVNANDTVIVATQSDSTVTILPPTDAGGTPYNSIGNISLGFVQIALWASAPSGAFATTQVNISVASAVSDIVGVAARYSGVSGFGVSTINAGSTANPTISQSTTATNSFIVSGFANDSGLADSPLTGNLRATTTFGGGFNNTVSLVDSTAASPALLTTAVTQVASTWVVVAVEMFAAGQVTFKPSEDSWMPPPPSPSTPNVIVW
jgi:hypothetical protein